MKILSGFCLPFFVVSQFIILSANAQINNQTPNSTIKISFIHAIDSQPLVLDSTKYANYWKETFTVSRLSYYISNVSLQTMNKKVIKEKNSYHLINEEEEDSKHFSFPLSSDQYTSLSFLIGVDSLKNVSGAQTGALDPLNGMFWTWNTGYIMFKMEGNSPESSIANHKVEYHIGGFSGINNALRNVRLNFNNGAISINKEKITEIIIRTDLDKIWKGAHDLKIAKTAVCTMPGALASGIADNYSKAFEIVKIISK
jgi:hypothetical protein